MSAPTFQDGKNFLIARLYAGAITQDEFVERFETHIRKNETVRAERAEADAAFWRQAHDRQVEIRDNTTRLLEKAEAELALAKDDATHQVSVIAKLDAEIASLRAQLRERTQWQCACGGTDCAGQAENERLRAEVERQTRETTKWAQSLLARTEAAEVRAARWKEQAEFSETQRTKLDGENDQLRARVAELEADKARCYVHLNHLLSWASQDPTGPWNKEEIQRWVINEITSAIDVARAGKGAT